MRLYRAVCAWLEAAAADMEQAPPAPERESAVDALVETAHQYTGQPEMHLGHRGTTFDDFDDRAVRPRRISLRWTPS